MVDLLDWDRFDKGYQYLWGKVFYPFRGYKFSLRIKVSSERTQWHSVIYPHQFYHDCIDLVLN